MSDWRDHFVVHLDIAVLVMVSLRKELIQLMQRSHQVAQRIVFCERSACECALRLWHFMDRPYPHCRVLRIWRRRARGGPGID